MANVAEYAKALRMGQRAYRNAVSRGEYPYLPALDDILECVDVQSETSLGLVDIPMEQIVGTKTAGRQNAFAADFMPLMPEKSEFATKWANVYEHQTEDGVSDPIIAYEFLNKFYVQEGNKRVSVLKFLNASSIEGVVTRVIPKPSDNRESRIYYEFLDFYKDTAINYLWFTREGSFAQLTRAVGKKPGQVWSDEEKQDFASIYLDFCRQFEDRGGGKLPITAGDAFLFYLSLYPYDTLAEKSMSERKEDLDRIWKEISLLNQDPEQALVLEPAEDPDNLSLTRFIKLTSSKQLKVAFIHDRPVESSGWTYSHELGRTHLEQVFGDKIKTSSYFVGGDTIDISQLLEQVISQGNHIIFTTNQKFLASSLKAALEHPETKILNCSVNRPYSSIRTYYGRMYEAKFLCGMVAGAMCENEKIGYLADYPILGSFANINAFALGARMVNPRVKVYLYWSSMEKADCLRQLREENISLISDNDMIRPGSRDRRFGLYREKDGEYLKLATPIWDWGKFYEKIIRDILKGNWNKTSDTKEKKALNYWWGISGNIIDLICSQNLPSGVRRLVEVMKREIYTEQFHPFAGEIVLQDGSRVGREDGSLSPEEIITMDWLVENVVGTTPPLENFTKEARALAAVQGSLAPAGEIEE